ncbi:hypothetical protein DM01DRAFT_305497 [Hesseltinella vesiculosa]|uniref:Uncharacterized protein n=1 Tax=Hesseltinella vesiculosa TaxID=101127 RepID=A0A1X2GCQ7_9FUNG|nr:hypothetical protein DM01DRAFT_305497 [Hesseltinella vesiculosa]
MLKLLSSAFVAAAYHGDDGIELGERHFLVPRFATCLGRLKLATISRLLRFIQGSCVYDGDHLSLCSQVKGSRKDDCGCPVLNTATTHLSQPQIIDKLIQ